MYCIPRYKEIDSTLYEKCSRDHNDKIRKMEAEKEASAATWDSIVAQAVAAGIDVANL